MSAIVKITHRSTSKEILIVKIIKCSGGGYWYKDKIGRVFTVKDVGEQGYQLIKSNVLALKLISREDCKIINSEKEEELNNAFETIRKEIGL